jgi:GTP-binding protein LepA
MTLCLDKRGILIKQTYISSDRAELSFDLPLAEIVFDFYDKLKSISKGYASFDYHLIGHKPARLVKLDILLNSEPVDALSSLIHFDNAERFGRRMCEKLKELIPRQQSMSRFRRPSGKNYCPRNGQGCAQRCYSQVLWGRYYP